MTSETGSAGVRHLAVILAADVVGFRRMMEQDERGTLERLLALRTDLIAPQVTAWRGRLFKIRNDGFLVEFASAADALRCALALQSALAAMPQSTPLQLRIGVNMGEVFRAGEDVLGDGVNLAARILALAEPGSIYLSRAVSEQVREPLEGSFEDLGPHQVKNLSRPIQVFRLRRPGEVAAALVLPLAKRRALPKRGIGAFLLVLALCAAWQFKWLPFGPRATAWSQEDRRMSFAVLPFEAPKDDDGAQLYAKLLGEEIIARLGSEADAGTVMASGAAPVEAAFLLKGSVVRAGEHLDSSVSITDMANGRALGVERMLEIGAVGHNPQRGSLLNLIAGLMARARKAEAERVLAMPLKERDARDLITSTWPRAGQRSREAYDQMIALLEQAQALAPDQARVKTQLGLRLAQRAENMWAKDPAADFLRAHALLGEVLKNEPNNIEALHGRELTYMGEQKWAEALAVGQKILGLSPVNRAAHVNNAICLNMLGRSKEALALLEHVPRSPDDGLDVLLSQSYGKAFLSLGRYAEAAASFQAAAVAIPVKDYATDEGAASLLHLAGAAALAGDTGTAKQALRDFRAANPALGSIAAVRAKIHFLEDSPSLLASVFDGLRKAGLPENQQ